MLYLFLRSFHHQENAIDLVFVCVRSVQSTVVCAAPTQSHSSAPSFKMMDELVGDTNRQTQLHVTHYLSFTHSLLRGKYTRSHSVGVGQVHGKFVIPTTSLHSSKCRNLNSIFKCSLVGTRFWHYHGYTPCCSRHIIPTSVDDYEQAGGLVTTINTNAMCLMRVCSFALSSMTSSCNNTAIYVANSFIFRTSSRAPLECSFPLSPLRPKRW